MSTFEFTLIVLIVLALFLAFALAVTAMLFGSRQAQGEVRKIFQTSMKTLLGLRPKD
ncbi:MAG: hypothetical protein M3416_02540 [Acidobacteriota bacterium]|nr:hypothetical protein [Acidobacteriota bacterium]